jgi:hypothetical protein
MAARPVLTDVAMSNFGFPMTGEVQKTPIIVSAGNAGYAWSTGASGDTITVGADYGIYSTTHSSNVAVEMTTLRDSA